MNKASIAGIMKMMRQLSFSLFASSSSKSGNKTPIYKQAVIPNAMPAFVKKPSLAAMWSEKFSESILAKMTFMHPPAMPRRNLPKARHSTISLIVIVQLMIAPICTYIAALLLPF